MKALFVLACILGAVQFGLACFSAYTHELWTTLIGAVFVLVWVYNIQSGWAGMQITRRTEATLRQMEDALALWSHPQSDWGTATNQNAAEIRRRLNDGDGA